MAERRRTKQGTRGGSTGSRRSASSRSRSTEAARKEAAKRGGQARGRQQRARSQARTVAAGATKPAEELDATAKTAAELREFLTRSLVRPLDILMLTRDRIEEVVNEAVERGRMTADDAAELASRLVQRGRKQTNDVLRDLEDLLGRGRDEIEGARERGSEVAKRARRQVEQATRGALKATDPALAQADRVRRAAGVGPSFPIVGYDDLTAAQVQGRLGSLSAAELRKVRDYERRHANRKTVLTAIERKLAA